MENNIILPKLEFYKTSSSKINDLSSKKFNKLSVVTYYGTSNDATQSAYWLCKCDCGRLKVIRGTCLKTSRVKSCGLCEDRVKKTNKNHALWRGHGDISIRFFNKIKCHAEQKNREFDIDIEYIWDLFLKQKKRCALSGVDLRFAERSRYNKECSASLDRIDSTKGYVVGNVQWIHKDVNKMKSNFDNKYFVDFCKKIAKNG